MTTTSGEDRRLLQALAGEGPVDFVELSDRLATRAAAEGLLDLAYDSFDSPLGSLLLVTSPLGLVRVAFPSEGHDATLEALADELSPRILRVPARLAPVERQLDEYFAGRRRDFDIGLDLALARGFRREVLGHLREVAYGTTLSYSGLAASSGRPRAVRAAASACSHNPIPVVIPCHRILRNDGGIGGYGGGLWAKRLLLGLEGVSPP